MRKAAALASSFICLPNNRALGRKMSQKSMASKMFSNTLEFTVL
jgi:hypothetical protein